jgi:hypothetical protein
MTSVSLTSGEIMDLLGCVYDYVDATKDENPRLSAYYGNIGSQFEMILDKLNELPGEKKVATLVLAAN